MSLCLDLLRLWDTPPLSESRSRVWLELDFATCVLRLDDRERARAHLKLDLLAHILGEEGGREARERAMAAARRLEDEGLLGRVRSVREMARDASPKRG